MTRLRNPSSLVLSIALLLGGCAAHPINPPIAQVDLSTGYRYETRQQHLRDNDKSTLVILAFSGGGTRAAAFSYGVLEACGASKSSGLRVRRLACSMKSTSSPASQAAVSRPSPSVCTATNCSTFMKQRSSNATSRASSS